MQRLSDSELSTCLATKYWWKRIFVTKSPVENSVSMIKGMPIGQL